MSEIAQLTREKEYQQEHIFCLDIAYHDLFAGKEVKMLKFEKQNLPIHNIEKMFGPIMSI